MTTMAAEHETATGLVRPDGYRIVHARGEDLKRARAFVSERHYSASPGGTGFMFVVSDPAGAIAGACLVGKSSSQHADRDLIAAPWAVRCCKRLVAADSSPVEESMLLWYALRQTANLLGETVLVASYADPEASDRRSGRPLSGYVYHCSNHYFLGLTRRQRYAVLVERGRLRSARQGTVTLGRHNLPPGWTRVPIRPARIFAAIVTPEYLTAPDGSRRRTTRRWRRHQWHRAWASVHPDRRVAAIQWIEARAWGRLARAGTVPLGEPRALRGNARRQPALWQGVDLRRGAAPVWVPPLIQGRLLEEPTVLGEATAGRVYGPRCGVAPAVDGVVG